MCTFTDNIAHRIRRAWSLLVLRLNHHRQAG